MSFWPLHPRPLLPCSPRATDKYNPFLAPEKELSDIWWKYARKTGLYEQLLCSSFSFKLEKKIDEINKKKVLENKSINQIKKEPEQKINSLPPTKEKGILRLSFLFFFYCTLYCFSFGKKRAQLHEKVDIIHASLFHKLMKKLYQVSNQSPTTKGT